MIKYLITGANGQVGHQLVAQLQGRADILATTHQTLDITNQSAVLRTVRTACPHVIINAAAYTAVDKAESERNLAFSINELGVKYLAQAAREVDAVILHISTDYVFDGKSQIPYRETDLAAPQNIYGQSKLAGEMALKAICQRHIILRTSWVFNEYGNNFVKTMLRLGAERDSLGVVADQFGAPTYAGDIAAALIQIAEKIFLKQSDNFGVYHFSGSPYVSWFDFAREIFAQAKQQNVLAHTPLLNPITTAAYPTPAARPAHSHLDCTKILENFGIVPSDWRRALLHLKDYR